MEQSPESPPESSPELESFYRVGRFLSSILDTDELLRAILEEGLRAVRGTRGFVGLVNRSTGELETRITAGAGWEDSVPRRFLITDRSGNGIVARVAASGIPYVTGDVRQDPHYVMVFADVRSEIAVPLVNRDRRVIGVINVESESIDAFSQRDLQLLVALANQAAIAISVANHRARETVLIEIGKQLSAATDMDELFRRIVHSAQVLLRTDDCSLFQLNAEGSHLILRATGPMLADRVGQQTYAIGQGLTGWVAQHPQPTRVRSVREDPRWRGLYPGLPTDEIESFLAVPVFERSQPWGVLRVLRRHRADAVISNEFTDRDEALLTTLAGQVGASITQQTLIARQVEMERMAAWGEMSARSAHMIGNRVFALKGQVNELEHLLRSTEVPLEEVRSVLGRTKLSIQRLEEILSEFKDFLMATHLQRSPVDPAELVWSIVTETLGKHGGAKWAVTAEPGLPPIEADAGKLRRAISELLENAVHHQPAGGTIRVEVSRWTAADRARWPGITEGNAWTGGDAAISIQVRDEGPGIPPENKPRLYTPFFTTRARGMGLGLSIVKGIVDAHRGAIAEVGEPGEGARFVIVLPVSQDAEPVAEQDHGEG